MLRAREVLKPINKEHIVNGPENGEVAMTSPWPS